MFCLPNHERRIIKIPISEASNGMRKIKKLIWGGKLSRLTKNSAMKTGNEMIYSISAG